MQFLYFPINWRLPIKSRALAYLIGREHVTVARQLQSMFGRLEQKSHKHRYVNNSNQEVEWTVWCFELSIEQVLKYVGKYSPHMLIQIREEINHAKQSDT